MKQRSEGMGSVDDETDVVGHAEFEHGVAVHAPGHAGSVFAFDLLGVAAG